MKPAARVGAGRSQGDPARPKVSGWARKAPGDPRRGRGPRVVSDATCRQHPARAELIPWPRPSATAPPADPPRAPGAPRCGPGRAGPGREDGGQASRALAPGDEGCPQNRQPQVDRLGLVPPKDVPLGLRDAVSTFTEGRKWGQRQGAPWIRSAERCSAGSSGMGERPALRSGTSLG
jgi:hypothetical protein